MPDAFEALRRPLVPLAPDPGFAGRLRARLQRELSGARPTTATAPVRRQGTLTPYLAVSPARDAIEWYVDVFEAVLLDDPIVMPDDRIGHAELMIGDSLLMLADAHPEIGHAAPSLDAGTPVMLTVQVPDADLTVERARRSGALVDREVSDTPYGHRGGTIRDPFGHRWSVQSPVRAPAAKRGDLVHVSLQVPDAVRAEAFYGAVLDWQFEPGRRVRGQNLSLGLWAGTWPGVVSPGVLLVWHVDDVEASAAAVRAEGGKAGPVQRRPYGLMSDCVDNQGLGFSLHQDLPDAGAPTPAPEPRRHGDVEYVTIGAPDENAAAAFYGAVLGWEVRPGHVAHGLELVGPTPPGGLWGGDADRQRVQLMFRVDDVAAAAERVRAAGGTAGSIDQMPYGRSVDCVDDQGMRFWLLQP